MVTSFTQLFGYTSCYYNDPNYCMNTTSTTTDSASLGTILLVMGISFLFMAVVYAIAAWLLSRIFKKAGVAQWKAWVPFYNNWTMLELGGQQGFWAVLAVVPILAIVSGVFMYIAMYNIGLRLGKSGAFVLWAIFLPIVWMIWLAFDNSTWQGPNVAAQPSSGTPSQPAAM